MCFSRDGYYTWEDRSTDGTGCTKGGVAICISACDDGQVSVDTSVSIIIFTFLHVIMFILIMNSLEMKIHNYVG